MQTHAYVANSQGMLTELPLNEDNKGVYVQTGGRPLCNEANGMAGDECIITKAEPAKPARAQRGSYAQVSLPTCDQWITVNCQPVCDADLTVGCTEGRTPELPRRDRYEHKWTYKPQQTTLQPRTIPRDGVPNTFLGDPAWQYAVPQ